MRILQECRRYPQVRSTVDIMSAPEHHTPQDHAAEQHADSAHRHGAHATIERTVDVAVVGGSAAGLAAALQLARQRRSVVVIDSGEPRNAPAAHMHSYLGHEGRPPADFLRIAREEVRSYGAEVLTGRVLDVTREDDGFRAELDRLGITPTGFYYEKFALAAPAGADGDVEAEVVAAVGAQIGGGGDALDVFDDGGGGGTGGDVHGGGLAFTVQHGGRGGSGGCRGRSRSSRQST